MRRFFAFILCIALCISLLPQAAFATVSTNSGYSFDAVGGKVYYRILSNVATIRPPVERVSSPGANFTLFGMFLP